MIRPTPPRARAAVVSTRRAVTPPSAAAMASHVAERTKRLRSRIALIAAASNRGIGSFLGGWVMGNGRAGSAPSARRHCASSRPRWRRTHASPFNSTSSPIRVERAFNSRPVPGTAAVPSSRNILSREIAAMVSWTPSTCRMRGWSFVGGFQLSVPSPVFVVLPAGHGIEIFDLGVFLKQARPQHIAHRQQAHGFILARDEDVPCEEA